MNYPWAANAHKLARAIGTTKGGTEEQVMKEYLSIGGLLTAEEFVPGAIITEPVAVGEIVEVKESKVKRAVKAVKKVIKKK